MDSTRNLDRNLVGRCRGTGCRRPFRHRGTLRGRHVCASSKRGGEIGKTKVGKGCKIELVTDANGIPIGVATSGAHVAESELIVPALQAIPDAVELPFGVPLIADKAYDSDPLRDKLATVGIRLLSPHRQRRVKPSSNDGREMRRYRRRWKIERTIGWLHSFRKIIVRHEYHSYLFDGFVYLGLALICLSKF